MNDSPSSTELPTPAYADQSAFVSVLLERQDEVLEGLSALEQEISLVIEALALEREAEQEMGESLVGDFEESGIREQVRVSGPEAVEDAVPASRAA